MSKIETSITITVYADPDYHYEVISDELLSLDYVEGDRREHIGFGSIDEMIAVAKAMLKVVELTNERTN